MFALLVLGEASAHAQEAQFQQARQLGAAQNLPLANATPLAAPGSFEMAGGSDTESFGVQQLLKEQERQRYFHAYSQISALVGSNVALTHVNPRSDAFLVASLGLEGSRPLGHGWQLDSSLQLSMFRYDKYHELDFNSLDVGLGVSYHLNKLGGLDLFARYDYTALTGTHSADPFLQSHTAIIGAQKSIAFNPAHGIYFGVAAQTSWTDPRSEERSEFAAFAGYKAQLTRNVRAELLYRYAYIPYTDSGRRDNNQTVSLGLHYRPKEWLDLGAIGFAAFNDSNIEAFKYEDYKGGVAVTLDIKF